MTGLLVIWGGGGHGKVVLDVARSTPCFERIVFIDDYKNVGSFCDCRLIGGPEELPRLTGATFIVAVGDNRARARCYGHALGNGLLPRTLIHPSAIIAPSASIGRGTVVMPGVIVNAAAVIGENCIVNSGAIVEHDCIIGDHVHISPRVVLGGGVRVGVMAHIGIGAIALPGVTIGDRAVVGAGCVVLRSVDPATTVVGVPARVVTRVQL